MADVASRSFKMNEFSKSAASSFNNLQYTPHSNFAHTFNKLFPLQQPHYWTEFQLPAKLVSRVMSCLRGQPLTMASWLQTPKQDKNTGLTGQHTAKPSTKTPTSGPAANYKKSSSSQLSLHGSGQASTDLEIKSRFKPLQTRYQPSQRQSCWLENRPRSIKHLKLTSSQWHGSSKDIVDKTHQQCHSLQSQSLYRTNVTPWATNQKISKIKQSETCASSHSTTSCAWVNTPKAQTKKQKETPNEQSISK